MPKEDAMKTCAGALFATLALALLAAPVQAQSKDQCYDQDSRCANPPADWGYSDSHCDRAATYKKYQFDSRRQCLAAMDAARQTLTEWCSCKRGRSATFMIDIDSGPFKPGCRPLDRERDSPVAFCVDLPARTDVERRELSPALAAIEPIQPIRHTMPCHDSRSWCANPPADWGYPDARCAILRQIPDFFIDTDQCLDVMVKARELQEDYCKCRLEEDLQDSLKPGCFYYKQKNGWAEWCIRAYPRDDGERQALSQLRLKECEADKARTPADWRKDTGPGNNPRYLTRDIIYQHCVAEAKALATNP